MQKLTDQDIAQCLLKDEKVMCSMLNNSILESSNGNLRQDWNTCLQNTYQMQKQIFDTMSQKGWYQPTKADMQQMNQAQSQFANNQMQ
jgi:spore coat protein CotF